MKSGDETSLTINYGHHNIIHTELDKNRKTTIASSELKQDQYGDLRYLLGHAEESRNMYLLSPSNDSPLARQAQQTK